MMVIMIIRCLLKVILWIVTYYSLIRELWLVVISIIILMEKTTLQLKKERVSENPDRLSTLQGIYPHLLQPFATPYSYYDAHRNESACPSICRVCSAGGKH